MLFRSVCGDVLELGLPEVEDIPADRRRDPMWIRSGGVDPGRDGCRVPLPWSGDRPPYGFSADGVSTWLDQPADWAGLTVEAESADSASTLNLYRDGLRIRRAAPWVDGAGLSWLPTPDDVLAFERGERFVCLVNFGTAPYPLPDGAEVLLASDQLEGGAVPQDTTVWLRQAVHQPPTGQGKEER